MVGNTAPTQSSKITPATMESSKTLRSWKTSEAHWPKSDWWTRYGDTQLNELIVKALADNPSLHIAQARLRLAAAQAGSAEAAQGIQGTLSLKDSRQRYSENSTYPKPLAGSWQTYNEVMLNVGYEFDFWGKNEAAFEAALDREHAAQVDTQAARLMVASSVVQTYLRYAQYNFQLQLAESNLSQREAVLELTRQRRSAGLDSEVELKQADGAVPASRQQIVAMREQIALAKLQLATLTGAGPDQTFGLIQPTLDLSQIAGLPSSVPMELIGRRPDVVAQRWRVEATAREIKVAKTQFYPNISLISYIGLQSLGLNQFVDAGSRVAGLGPAISLPIFDGGRLRSNLGARNAEYDIAVEQYNATLLDALQDVVTQLTSIQSVTEQSAQQAHAVKSSEVAFDLAMQRYKAGTGNYLQVLAVKLQLQAQQKLLIDLQARALQLDANLTRALGGGTLGSDTVGS